MDELTEDQVYERFFTFVRQIGGQRELARQTNLTPSYINDMVHKRRPIAESVLARLGVERVVIHRVTYQTKD